ncbi:hypothetical protein, partial [Escherichia coli]|uniref:hypothetical protein n=1 Tax=Escherichia coli TaxID=562 RepID=UPI003F4C1297
SGGRSLWKKRQRRGLLLAFAFLLTCSFRLYPLILWITVLPLLSELTPLAAVERPSVASQ